MVSAGAPAWAADCGDKAGAGGSRVACACGDTVITSTTLRPGDPVADTVCAGVGLSIGDDNITLNCNGREMSGEDVADAGILLADRTGVTVRNCKISGFFRGIWLLASSGNRLLSNTISLSGLGMVLEDDSGGNLVKSNRVVEPGSDGINLGSGASGNMIVGNTLEGTSLSGDGIDFDGTATDNTVKGNKVTGFMGASGIELFLAEGNVVTENVSSGNGFGISLRGNGNTIERNTTDENEADGIDAGGDNNVIDKNRARRNFGNGITMSGNGNIISRNTADGNQGAGISVDGDDNTIDQNRGKGNSFSGLEVAFGTGNVITRNTFDDNAEDGIFVGADGGTIDGNRGRRNGDDGLDVSGIDNTVSSNTFENNPDWNICVGLGNTDGGGNRFPPDTFDCP
jgi:parallel beta-helix repeat protein